MDRRPQLQVPKIQDVITQRVVAQYRSRIRVCLPDTVFVILVIDSEWRSACGSNLVALAAPEIIVREKHRSRVEQKLTETRITLNIPVLVLSACRMTW